MIKMRSDTYEINLGNSKLNEEDTRYIVLSYNEKTDMELISKIHKFLYECQPNCSKCKNHYVEGCLGGYMASMCKIHGNLEAFSHPMHDEDASKCVDYKLV